MRYSFCRGSRVKTSWTVRILTILLILLIQTANLSANDKISNYDLSEEDQAHLLGLAEAYSNTVKQAKADLTKIQTYYDWVIDNLANHNHPEIVDAINTLDKANFRKHLKGFIGALSVYEDQIKVITDVKGDYDKAKNFMDRYRPDKNNPMRSLEQIGNALEDLNTLIKTVDLSGGVATKPIREIIIFFKDATAAYKNALGRIETKIKERGGNGIGEGLTGTTDKDREFLDKFPGVTAYRYTLIKYNKPGTDLEEAEFWEDQGGRVFVWKDGNWQELRCGIAGLKDVFDGLFLANGVRPNIKTLISASDVEPEMLADAKSRANRAYGLIYADRYCSPEMLLNLGFKKYAQKVFVAKYIFDSGFTKKADRVIEKLEHSVFVEGRVVEEGQQDKEIKGAAITAVTPAGKATCSSASGGWFSMIVSVPSSGSRTTATVKVNVPGYDNYEKSWPLDGRCNRWYNIALQKSGVQVPELSGKTVDQAFDMLEALNLKGEYLEGDPAPAPEQANIIVWQSPSHDQTVPTGTTVTFRAYVGYIPPESPDTEQTITDNGGSDIGGGVPPTPEGEGNEEDTQSGSTLLEGYDGGVFISGPAVMVAGESGSFSACDGQGKQYPASGNYAWFSTMEDTLVLQKSGNPVRGSAQKAGKATILLKFYGGNAWFDLKIKAKVPNVVQMSYQKAAGVIDRLNLVSSAPLSSNAGDSKDLVVLSQTPAPGTLVDAETKISLELGKGDPRDDTSEESIFSVAGGEKIDSPDIENDNPASGISLPDGNTEDAGTSIFSVSGGGKIDPPDINNDRSDSGFSLLGENTETGEREAPGDNRNAFQSQGKKPELVLIQPSRTVKNRYGFHDRYYHTKVQLRNVPYETILKKKAYLLMKIGDREYYVHYFNPKTSMFECAAYYTGITGQRRMSLSCPNLPNVPAKKFTITIEPIPSSYKQKSILPKIDKTNLANTKNLYINALKKYSGNKDHIKRTHLGYANALARCAEGYAELGDYSRALPMITEAKAIYESYNLQKNHESKKYYQILARRSQILLECSDRQTYLESVRLQVGVLHNLRTSVFKDHAVYQFTTQVAEQLFTAGFDENVVKPFYQKGIKYMPADKKENFLNYRGREDAYNSTYSGSVLNYFNCAEIFVKRKQLR